MRAAQQLAEDIGNVKRACAVAGVPRASFYHERAKATQLRLVQVRLPARRPARALSDEERRHVLEILHSPRFVDMAPAQVHAELLDEGRYICSPRTMYRVLGDQHEVRERRAQRRHPPAVMPHLAATAPNQVWTWDISKLPTVIRGLWLALYVVLDLFSRYVVGWLVARHERGSLARLLIEESCVRHGVEPGGLTIHADRGSPMKSKSVAELAADLGVTLSFSRPRTSNDNPFSEAGFRTFKYSPTWPGRFQDEPHARAWARDLFHWYNTRHRHSSLAMLTPETVYQGRAEAALARQHAVRFAAYQRHPERFLQGPPRPRALPAQVCINPVTSSVELVPAH